MKPEPLASPFKFYDLGPISSKEIDALLEEITKAWDKDIFPLMAEKPKTFTEIVKADATNAAYRVAAKQVLNITRGVIVEYSRKIFTEEGKIRTLIEFLDTEVGAAVMAMFIGIAVSQIPKLSSNKKMNRILKELRVDGMAGVGNAGFELMLKSILPVIATSLQDIEKASSVAEDESLLLMDQELISDSKSLRQS